MKRSSVITFILTLVFVLSCAVTSFAADQLVLESSYPEDGQKNMSVENVGVKLYFNNEVDKAIAVTSNTNHVRIVDEEGNSLPLKVVAQGNMMLVLGDSTAENYKVSGNTTYTLVIDPEFRDNQGNELGTETKISFTTFNQKLNSYISMAMMFVMFGGIMFATTRKGNGAEKAKEEEATKGKVNPYRESKKTGKSVEEIVAKQATQKEKKSHKAERQAEKEQAIREKLLATKEYSLDLPYVYKVKRPRPISEAGKKEEPKKQQSKTRQKATAKGGKKK